MSSSKGTILLTGPNGGIGIGFVTQLLKSPYALTHEAIYAVRDPDRAMDLKAALELAPKNHNYTILAVDFASLQSIRAFAADVNSRVASGSIAPISALIHNAGVQDTKLESFTNDGFERTFAINYLAIFLATLLLLQSMDKQHGRIIYIGSTATDIHWFVNDAYFSSDRKIRDLQKRDIVTTSENMAKGIEEHPDGDVMKTGQRRYTLSKILLEMWMYELQRRLDVDPELSNISVLGHDPGWIGGTGIGRNAPLIVKISLGTMYYLAYILVFFQTNPMIRTAKANGDCLLKVCFDRITYGEFPKAKYIDGVVEYKTVPEANNEEKQRELWNASLEFAGIKDGDTVLRVWK